MKALVRHAATAAAGVVGLLPVALLGLATAASADAPTKAGWWNAASANGFALPAPTTGTDNLHVAQGPGGPTAYAAVAYDLTGQSISGATLQLKVSANSAVGTTDVMACPTKDASWKAGGNQTYDTRPAYDCAKGVHGVAAADGTTVTFLLDAAQQLSGAFSLAIVPAQDAVPFSIDFDKPDATSLAPELDAAAEPAPVAADAPPPYQPPAGTGTASAPLSSGTVAQAPPVQLQAPVVSAPTVAMPAPAAAAAPVPPSAPVVAAKPVADSRRVRYEAGTLLALLTGAVVFAAQQPSKRPRLIGGMARKGGPVALEPVDAQPRGIGRFAAIRTQPARPLV
jgi:hypothetical protein